MGEIPIAVKNSPNFAERKRLAIIVWDSPLHFLRSCESYSQIWREAKNCEGFVGCTCHKKPKKL